MITIELDTSNILITLIASLASVVISVVATWYFSKSHYTRRPHPVTENDIRMEEISHAFRTKALGLVFVCTVFILFLLCNIMGSCRHDAPELEGAGRLLLQVSSRLLLPTALSSAIPISDLQGLSPKMRTKLKPR